MIKTMMFLSFITLIFVYQFKKIDASLNWLSIAKQKNIDLSNELICDRLIGWTPMQKRFCKNNFDFLNSIKKAALITLDECKLQFKSRRWNCSTTSMPNLFAKLPESGMREASFIYALSSAALSYQITTACTSGLLSDCSCYDNKEGVTLDGHKWSGCSDNIAYGMAISENFLDPKLKNKPNLIPVNLHNFEAGRRIVERNMVKQCKCHGLSGSCEVKTCWKALPSFTVIGNKLKQKYDEAIQIEVKNRASRGGNKRKIVSKYDQKITKSELIYLNESPDFCKPNYNLASYGTKGRICNKSSRGIDSCKLLCCGRQFKTKLETIKYNCSCTFTWCCSVTCKECTKTQYVSTCK